MREMLLRAFRDTLRSPRFPAALALGAPLSFLAVLLAGTSAQWLALPLVIPLAGYWVSYTREVISSDTASLPPFNEAGVFARRGCGMLVAMMPLELLLALPPLIVLGIADPEAILARQVVLPVVVFPVIAVATLAVQSRYAYFDRFREGIRYGKAFGAIRRHAALAVAPVVLDLLSAALNQLLRYGAATALGIPRVTPARALGLLTQGTGTGAHVAYLIVILGASVLGVGLTLATAHLIGQFAKVAFADEESSEVALTSASS